MIKVFYILFGSLVGMFALFLLFAPKTETNPSTRQINAAQVEASQEALGDKPALYIGNPEAPVTLVEYGDFKCPACNSFGRGVGAQLRQEYVESGQLNIEFRNLAFIGPDSKLAARGSYCANDQGKFAEYHDDVYGYIWDAEYSSGSYSAEFEDVFTASKLTQIMTGVVDDINKFKTCSESTEFDLIEEYVGIDLQSARHDGINGTPGFTIAGKKISGPQGYTTFKTLIDLELSR